MILVAACLYVIHKGLTKGIEFICKIVIPLFFLALVYMIIHALLLPGAITKFKEFLQPDWSLLHPTEIFAAMGQAFFSVGLGGTFVVEEYEIKTCDMSLFYKGGEAGKKEFARQLGEAMRGIGFAILTGHEVDAALYDEAEKKIAEFFETTTREERMKYHAKRLVSK